MRPLPTSSLVKYFVFATIISFCAAVAFTIPVIVPEFTFPLELTIWPGTWMFQAYFAFLIVGVLGNLGWAALLDLIRRNGDGAQSGRYLAFTHLALSNIGVYGATTLIFSVGYFGGAAALLGYAKPIITQSIIGWMVVPIGVFIYLYLVASVFGIANLVWMLTGKRGEADVDQAGGSRGRQRSSDYVFWGALIGLVSVVFIVLPILEIPFYPYNYWQEMGVMLASGVGAVSGLTLIAKGIMSRGPKPRDAGELLARP